MQIVPIEPTFSKIQISIGTGFFKLNRLIYAN